MQDTERTRSMGSSNKVEKFNNVPIVLLQMQSTSLYYCSKLESPVEGREGRCVSLGNVSKDPDLQSGTGARAQPSELGDCLTLCANSDARLPSLSRDPQEGSRAGRCSVPGHTARPRDGHAWAAGHGTASPP